MSFVKYISETYSDTNDIYKLVSYCMNGSAKRKDTVIYTFGVNSNDVNSIFKSMIFTKREFKKLYGRQLHHIIISIYPKNRMEISRRVQYANLIAYEIGQMIECFGFQVIATVHVNQIENVFNKGIIEYTPNVHIHFIINSVSYKNGHKLHDIYNFLMSILRYLKKSYPQLAWENILIGDDNSGR